MERKKKKTLKNVRGKKKKWKRKAKVKRGGPGILTQVLIKVRGLEEKLAERGGKAPLEKENTGHSEPERAHFKGGARELLGKNSIREKSNEKDYSGGKKKGVYCAPAF